MSVYVDGKMHFREHFRNIFKKVNKITSLLRKVQNNLPRPHLVAIYKSFVRPRQGYLDILCDQAPNNSFHERLELIQYNVALAK